MKKILLLILPILLIIIIIMIFFYGNNKPYIEVNLKSDMSGYRETNKIKIPISNKEIYDTIIKGIDDSKAINENPDVYNNNTYEYEITINSNSQKTVTLFYDTLYNKAYIKDEINFYSADENFALFVGSLLEFNPNTSIGIPNEEKALFSKYGWNIKYHINNKTMTLVDFSTFKDFNSSDYYFAYNNELSKDIDLDMTAYIGKKVNIDIYYTYESMPEKFYPIKNARAIVVKYDGNIIGAYLSSGRHSAENACSLKGNSFEEITDQNFSKFLSTYLKSDNIANKAPEEVIKEYFNTLNNNKNKAVQYWSAEYILSNLCTNMDNSELFNKNINLPFSDQNMKITNINTTESKNTDTLKVYNVTFDNSECWDFYMVYESKQTGWKIDSFGHG